ncbi:MAG TPA: hypothetical protein VGO61_16040 [Steroidobacteraceae bacterium]|jgi:hypothetical protein|nr:hypothetical protein [Steroidobacteraceae bacterium]
MAQLNVRSARIAYFEPASFEATPGPDKLDRLRELRAAIDCLRAEREARDPLLAWILERERAETS